tara:strand:+ start:530 stop:736 length:207 start_codon:yes stop_codon:yes gene_type:complete
LRAEFDETDVTLKTELPPRPEPAPTVGQGTRVITSAELFGGDDEIAVLHNGATYRLRVTRQDKLILTK